jgi:hypothetical protein
MPFDALGKIPGCYTFEFSLNVDSTFRPLADWSTHHFGGSTPHQSAHPDSQPNVFPEDRTCERSTQNGACSTASSRPSQRCGKTIATEFRTKKPGLTEAHRSQTVPDPKLFRRRQGFQRKPPNHTARAAYERAVSQRNPVPTLAYHLDCQVRSRPRGRRASVQPSLR